MISGGWLAPSASEDLRLQVSESRFLPVGVRKVPFAGSGLVVVDAGICPDCSSRSPVVHAHLQQGAGRNLGLHLHGASCQLAARKFRARRTPEIVNAIRALA